MSRVSRRGFLGLGGGAVALSALALRPFQLLAKVTITSQLSRDEWITIALFADVIIPKTATSPAASDAGVTDFLKNLVGKKFLGFPIPKNKMNWTKFYAQLAARIEARSKEMFHIKFSKASGDQQNKLVEAFSKSSAAQVGYKITGIDVKDFYSDQELYSNARTQILQGYFADPKYGGNKDFASWKAVGYTCHFNYPNQPETCPPHDM